MARCCLHATWSTHSTPHSGKIGDQGIVMAALQLCIHVSMYPSPPALLCIHVSRSAACRVVEPSSASARGYRGPRHWLHSLMAASTRHINSFIRPQPPRDAWGYPNFWRCIPACRIAHCRVRLSGLGIFRQQVLRQVQLF